jgi:hypothetical protein
MQAAFPGRSYTAVAEVIQQNCVPGQSWASPNAHHNPRWGQERVGRLDYKEGAMATSDKPVELERVACAICRKEVPISEAAISEATDYVVYFCGLDCYEKWKSQSEKPEDQVEKPGS